MLALLLLLLAQTPAEPEAKPADDSPKLSLSQPVACRKIKGYEEYEELEPAELTRDEKLLIYTRTKDHTYVLSKGRYQAHLVEDVAIRRKGSTKTLWTRKKAIDFKVDSETEPRNLYLGTTIGLKVMEPGEYEAELIVFDELTENPPARQVLPFKIVPRGERKKPATEEAK